MVNITIKRNVWLAGASRKSGTQISTFSQQSFPYSANAPYPLFVEAKHTVGGVDYPIGFVSVTGGANGHFVILGYPSPHYAPAPSDLPPPFQSPPAPAEASTDINIGDNDVAITLWYLPAGSGPGPGVGTYVASFDIDKNDFFFDPAIPNDFVSVAPDAALTGPANQTGSIPTTNAETITANAAILGVPFVEWAIMENTPAGSDSIAVKALKTAAKSGAYAIGFYATANQHRPSINYVDFYAAMWHALYPGEAVDAPKPGGGDPPQWRGLMQQLATLLTMNDKISHVISAHRAEAQTAVIAGIKGITAKIDKATQGRS